MKVPRPTKSLELATSLIPWRDNLIVRVSMRIDHRWTRPDWIVNIYELCELVEGAASAKLFMDDSGMEGAGMVEAKRVAEHLELPGRLFLDEASARVEYDEFLRASFGVGIACRAGFAETTGLLLHGSETGDLVGKSHVERLCAATRRADLR